MLNSQDCERTNCTCSGVAKWLCGNVTPLMSAEFGLVRWTVACGNGARELKWKLKTELCAFAKEGS